MPEDALLSVSQQLRAASLALGALTVYRQLLDGDQVIRRLQILTSLCQGGSADLETFPDRYCSFFAALTNSTVDSLEDYLVEAILFHDNPFTRSLECQSHSCSCLEHKPANVLIYATSNRRHLITERFSDRDGLQSGHGQRGQAPSTAPGEVHAGDTIQEKLSLADRFGITAIFSTSDQDQYLEIVEGIALRRGPGLTGSSCAGPP